MILYSNTLPEIPSIAKSRNTIVVKGPQSPNVLHNDVASKSQFISKQTKMVHFIGLTFLIMVFAICLFCNFSLGLQLQAPQSTNLTLPYMNDSALKVETVFQGLNFPTGIDFLGPNDILVLEKNEGTVKRIMNGTMLAHPLLQVNVSSNAERGLLGIAVSRHNDSTFVFLYFTESGEKGNVNPVAKPLGNRLYRYELVDNSLIRPKLLLDLPATPGTAHNGGKVIIGPDSNVYLVIGDINSVHSRAGVTQAQNIKNGLPPDGRGGILRVTQDGNVVPNGGIIGDKLPLSIYYAYGIRNSFGIAFDPVTKKLWDAENGPSYGDEINLVEPGFNSGWGQVQGIWKPNHDYAGNITLDPDDLVDFGGRGKYALPKFIWNQTIGPTALTFINSDKLGSNYKNDLFVGDFNQGRIFHLHLNKSRTGFDLDNPLDDNIANSNAEIKGIILGQGFGGITDLKVGPDGNLYVLSLYPGNDSKWYSADCDRKKMNNKLQNCISFSGSSVEGTIFRITGN
jgi:aldose sugar dehydrogenase